MNPVRYTLTAALFLALALVARAEGNGEHQEGLLTTHLNKAIEKQTKSIDWATPPKFGGYIIGQYVHDDAKGAKGGPGFGIRLLRAYVSGSLLRDFKYFVNVEMNGSLALRDATIDWSRWKEFNVKVGQFKRAYTMGTLIHPMENGMGTYTQLVCRMAGYGDYCGEPSMNGRDLGLQFYGDLFPVGETGHRLVHYKAAVHNGNGQNRADNNRSKDWMGTVQLQPLPGFYVGVFGWKGTYTQNGVTVGRNRWALSTRYNHDHFTLFAEYAHNTGHRIQDYDSTHDRWNGTARSDAWYVTFGVPVNRWLHPFVCYDAYREQGTWNSMKTMYSACLNFRLHKDLLFQLQYDFVDNRNTPADRYSNQFRALANIRF